MGRRRRQKRVDVQLTVDMLMDAVHRNMTHATLLTGDEDFLPLIEALEGLGTHVTVMYERRTGARRLHAAADAGVGITIREAHRWTAAAVKDGLTIPHEFSHVPEPSDGLILQRGVVLGRNLVLRSPERGSKQINAWIAPSRTENSVRINFDDPDRLKKYIELCYGPINWTS